MNNSLHVKICEVIFQLSHFININFLTFYIINLVYQLWNYIYNLMYLVIVHVKHRTTATKTYLDSDPDPKKMHLFTAVVLMKHCGSVWLH